MNFSEALELLKQEELLYRAGWNGVEAGIDMYVFLVTNANIETNFQANDIGSEPFFMFWHSKKDTYNMWVPSVWDLLADDWVQVL